MHPTPFFLSLFFVSNSDGLQPISDGHADYILYYINLLNYQRMTCHAMHHKQRDIDPSTCALCTALDFNYCHISTLSKLER